MRIVHTDNNQFLADGVTPNPNFGQVTETTVADPPTSPLKLSRLEFVTLCQTSGGMTDANLVSAKADAQLAALWIKLEVAQYVERDNANTQAGLTALAGLGYLPNGANAVTSAWPVA